LLGGKTSIDALIATHGVVFDLTAYTRHAPEIVARLDVIPPV